MDYGFAPGFDERHLHTDPRAEESALTWGNVADASYPHGLFAREKDCIPRLRRAALGGRWASAEMEEVDVERPSAERSETLAERIERASAGGHNLDAGARRELEAALAADLGEIRVHIDQEADALAQFFDAVAFTTGKDIFFREGAYRPESRPGLRLLAHEAAHVIQQAAGSVAGSASAEGVSLSDPSDQFERTADVVAAKAMAWSEQKSIVSGAAPPSMLRPGPGVLAPQLATADEPASGLVQEARAAMTEGTTGRPSGRCADDATSKGASPATAPRSLSASGRGWATVQRAESVEEAKTFGETVRERVALVNPEGASVETLIALYPTIENDPEQVDRLLPIIEGKLNEKAAQGEGEDLLRLRDETRSGSTDIQDRVDFALTQVSHGNWVAIAGRTFPFARGELGSLGLEAIDAREVDRSEGASIRVPSPWRIEYGLDTHGAGQETVEWHDTYMEIRERLIFSQEADLAIRISIANGAAADALDALWEGTETFSFECFTGASIIQLRGESLWYRANLPADSWRAVFDAQFGSFTIVHRRLAGGEIVGAMRSEGEASEADLGALGSNTWEDALRPGDWVAIQNPYLGGGWARENATYLGEREFVGHPIGFFTPEEYASYILNGDHGVRPPIDSLLEAFRHENIDEGWILAKSEVTLRFRPREGIPAQPKL